MSMMPRRGVCLHCGHDHDAANELLQSLMKNKAASTLSAQQPVAWYIEGGTQMWWQESRPTDPGEWEPLYASPPPAQQGPTQPATWEGRNEHAD